jgi:hypothetical protein
MIEDGAIVDADVNTSAAIAGTKISPNFGSQAVVTTGTSTAASFIPTSSSVPANGVYLPSANNVAISTNGAESLRIDSSGRLITGETHVLRDASNQLLGLAHADGAIISVGRKDTTVTADNGMGQIQFRADTGADADYNISASIACYAAGTHSATSSPGYLTIRTTPADQLTTEERLRITSTGALNFVGAGTAGSTQAVSFNGSAPVNSLVIDSSGRVGLGTGDPGSIFEAKGNSPQLIVNSTTASYPGLVFQTNGVSDGGVLYNGSGDKLEFYTGDTSGNPEVVIDASGRVGIGVTVPSSNLHIESNNYPSIRLKDSTEGGFAIIEVSPGGGMRFRADPGNEGTTAEFIRFDTAASERARIDSSGRLLVGTVASPAYQLQLETDSAGKPSTNTWTVVSDERIKEDIELADLDICYEAIKNIPLKRFKWKDEVYTEKQVPDRHKLGWIAQDVEAVFPKAVRIHEFKYNQVFEETVIPAVEEELDEDGNVITPAQPERIEKGELISEDVIEDCRDLNADQLYAAMYGTIQKLIAKVEALESELSVLKSA